MVDTMAPLDLTAEDGMRGKYLTFRVDDGDYGVDISYVTEIIEMQAITPVPHTPEFVKGITNLRGTITPVIDMRLRFGHQEMEYTDRTCIIVLTMDDMSIGMIVDEVQEVADIEDDGMQPPPKATGVDRATSFFVRAIGTFEGDVKQILDIDRVFGVGELPI